MIKHNQDGAVSALALSLGVAVLLLIGAIIFGAWAFSGRQDYKTNVDAKVATAVTVAKQQESTLKDNEFAQLSKQPLRAYNGPEAYGSLVVNFPKNWSGYVDDTGHGNSLVDGYFSPSIVPSLTDPGSIFALRVQVLGQSYSSVLQTISALALSGKVTVSPYALPKVPKTTGVKVSGTLTNGKSGTMVILPLRDKTLEIRTDGSQFIDDYNNNILPNFSFSP